MKIIPFGLMRRGGSTDPYGPNLVVNGGFDTADNWTLGTGWTISGGTANSDATSNNASMHQVIGSTEIGETYQIKGTVSNYVSGILLVGGSSSNLAVSANGEFTHNRVMTGTFLYFKSDNGSPFVGSIDNITYRKVL